MPSTYSANWFHPNYSECRIYVISFGNFHFDGHNNLLTIMYVNKFLASIPKHTLSLSVCVCE